MEKVSKATVSFGIILLICFFLPWVQVSCGASHDTATGLDLARDGEGGLWLIPLLTVVLILCGLRIIRINQRIFGVIALLSGLVSLYLMNHQRVKFEDSSGLISARLTGWFWFGLIAAIGIVVSGSFRILRRSRAP
jgi:hypothetical protein